MNITESQKRDLVRVYRDFILREYEKAEKHEKDPKKFLQSYLERDRADQAKEVFCRMIKILDVNFEEGLPE
ncbi:hypothetical protein [Succinimonas amylolytica]|uniref:hypothetical protein n=1 Tax=Succinimonas amylolytica TaxID=83769 RepID=UPI0023A86D88